MASLVSDLLVLMVSLASIQTISGFIGADHPVRLSGGSSSIQGRVEIYYNGMWGTVCDDGWGIKEGHVVCRQLGFDRAISSPCCARYGRGSGRVLMDEVKCTGLEKSLAQCRFDGWGNHYCDHGEDAGVVCAYYNPPSPEISPIGSTCPRNPGKSGECPPEPYYECGTDDECQQIHAGRGLKCCLYGCGTRCLTPIPPPSTAENNSSSKHSNISMDSTVRLTGGSSPSQGRVEIYYNGMWGTVCDDGWDINEAKVVCRQLGFERAILRTCCARFGRGSGQILMDEVKCTGLEKSLAQCRFHGWGNHDCSHSEDAGVICA